MITPTNVQGTAAPEKATPELRFVDGKLEQKWINVVTGATFWKRVKAFDSKERSNG